MKIKKGFKGNEKFFFVYQAKGLKMCRNFSLMEN